MNVADITERVGILKTRFEYFLAPERHSELLLATNKRVVQWRDATGEMLQLEPYLPQRNGWPVGRWCKKKKPDFPIHHGLDKDARIIVMREATPFPGCTTDTFIEYHDAVVMAVRYAQGDDHPLIAVSRFQREDAENATYLALAVLGCRFEKIRYEKGRPAMSEVWGVDSVRGKAAGRRYCYDYGDSGRISRITSIQLDAETEEAVGESVVCYARRQTGQTVASLEKEVEQLLVERVQSTLETIGTERTAYCVALVYDMENEILPPHIAVGFAEDRDRRLQQYGAPASAQIWNPATFRLFSGEKLQIADPHAIEACRLLHQELLQSDRLDRAIHILNRVASKLMEERARLCIKQSDDFVIVAVDLESQDHLERNMSKSVPLATRRLLLSRGLL